MVVRSSSALRQAGLQSHPALAPERHFFTLRRLTCCLLLPVYLAGCSSWYVQEVSPQQLVTEEQPGKIRVTLTDGSQVVLEQPRVSGDTLMGNAPKVAPSGKVVVSQQVNIPLSDVADVAIQRTDAGKTTGLILGTLLVVGAAVFIIFITTFEIFDQP